MISKVRVILVLILLLVTTALCSFLIGTEFGKKIIIDMNYTDIRSQTKYTFLPEEISNYICGLTDALELDTDLVIAILMKENPKFNPEAIHRNKNGTVDCGLFQLNDRYLWTEYKIKYWYKDLGELDPFNWKHNAYLAIHHIKTLDKQLKSQDEVIMAYNCGKQAVMSNRIPKTTKDYLSAVKNNLILLKKDYTF